MPWLRLMVTGGVEPTGENLSKWFGAGVTCVGMGSNLFPKKLIEAKDWAGITTTITRILELVKQIRIAK